MHIKPLKLENIEKYSKKKTKIIRHDDYNIYLLLQSCSLDPLHSEIIFI